ncbi:MAG: phosphatase PAP2 family protein, partial [Erysipelotrichaceae bacterium]
MTKKEWMIILLLAIFGLALSVSFDLEISSLLYNQSNWLGRFGEAFGEFPGLFIGALSSAILVLTRNKNAKQSTVSSSILGGLCWLILSILAGVMPSYYLHLPLWTGLILSLIVLVITILLIRKIPVEHYSKIRNIAWVGLLTLVCSSLFVSLLKMGWSRVRFRDMGLSVSAFTPWYLPNGFLGNYKWASFPSGHVATATVIFVFTLLPTVLSSLKKYNKLISIICYLWLIMVMLSRIIMGAHFLSDTIVGVLITLSLFQLFSNLL